MDRHAGGLDGFHQVEHAVAGVQVGRGFGDLRADVAVDADHLEARQPGGVLVGLHRAVVRDAELVALEAGGNVGMRLRVDVRIDADADRCAHLLGQRHPV
ncbi:hypothetical protein D9M69_699870 [compost metagenome]